MRKLATIRKVSEIRPIKDADLIELAIIGGWQVVVGKGEFSAGDPCIYFEIDSFLPIEERYEFLRKSCYRKVVDDEGFRLKTIKFRGQVSQGLALPLKKFPELTIVKEGEDVTEKLKIAKWEPPVPPELSGLAKGDYPGFITKTDEERIQNLLNFFTDFKDVEWEITVKLDGSSCTYYLREGEFGVCSRNTEWLDTEENTRWKVAKQLQVEERLRKLGRNIAIQGEVIGEGINKNNERLKGQHFYLFNIFDIDKGRYLDFEERYTVLRDLNQAVICEDIPHVPVEGIEKIFQKITTLDDMLEFAHGPSLNTQRNREGLVFKSRLINGYMTSFKVISNKYLLKNDE